MLYTKPRSAAMLLIQLFLFLSAPAVVAYGQDPINETGIVSKSKSAGLVLGLPGPPGSESVSPAISIASRYYDPIQGSSSSELVGRALASNSQLAAARLDIERARARLQQAGLRPNPTFDFEQTTGRLTGSPGERETSIGFALPLDVSGQRGRRIDLARAEVEAAEAEVADRERRLIAEVRASHAEVLAAVRELEITAELTNVDQQTARVVEVRVTEGDSAPIELNLLRSEVDRLRARGVLVEGRLQGSLIRLKNLVGIPIDEPLRLNESLNAQILPEPATSLEDAVDIALRTRPDLRFARLTEEVAQAGLRLARAQGAPDVTAFTKYTKNSSVFDNTPVGVLRDKDTLLTLGVSIGIPIFNRNQGAKAEAETAILQARRRREFSEAIVRSEVASAYARYAAVKQSLAIFEQGVLERSRQNIRAVRGAYEIGAFRVTDLLVEQRRFIDSQREFIEALAERYRALADLQAAIGLPVNSAQIPK